MNRTRATATCRPRSARRKVSWRLSANFEALKLARANRTIFGMIVLVGLTSLLVGSAHQAQLPEFSLPNRFWRMTRA